MLRLSFFITLLLLLSCTEQITKPIDEQPIEITQITPIQPVTSTHVEPPILDIDTGGHKALIKDIAFTPEGQYLVSAGDDKVIRIWDWQAGKTVRTIRGQMNEGSEGKIYAMALSPDGKWLAVGGWLARNTESAIRLYHFDSGRLVGLLKGHSNVINALAFSPDSRYLVSGSADDTAIIWEIKAQKRLHTLVGHTEAIYAVAFTSDNQRVVTGSDDHDLRLWQVSDGKQVAVLTGHKDKVSAVAVSPLEGTIASGSIDHTIRLWHGQTGDFIKQLADQGTKVGSLSFSPDGHQLLSGVGDSPHYCHLWSMPEGKELIEYREHDNAVYATAISPDGRWAATGGGDNKEIHIWDMKTGKTEQRLRGVGSSTWAIGFSEDGQWLAWGNHYQRDENHRGPLEHQLHLPEQTLGTPQPINTQLSFIRAQPQWQQWSLSTEIDVSYGYGDAVLNIQNNLKTVAQVKRGATNGYRHRAYTFTVDGQQIISGGANGVLTAYNKSGDKLGDYVGHTGDIWAVVVSPDGQLLASASVDQTVRLWNVTTFENIMTLFHGNNGEWVMWTPQGYYTSSLKGDQMIGWQINKGVDQVPDYIAAAQLRKHFYRPDIVENAIRLRSAKQAVAQVKNATFTLAQLNTEQPPQFQIINPKDNSRLPRSNTSIELQLEPNSKPLENVDIFVNGTLASITRFVGKNALPSTGGEHKQYNIGLQQGENLIEVVAKNQIGETRKTITIYLEKTIELPGDLYLLSIGVSQYQKANLSLNYADNDARDLYNQLIELGKKHYHAVHPTLLADGAELLPTADNIRDALGKLQEAKAEDTVIIFLAGHGTNEEDGYYFLPYDAQQSGNRWNNSSTIHWMDIQRTITNTKGKRLLLVDTCHSGGAIDPSLLKNAADENIIVIAATDYNNVAQEKPELQHGVFAYALLESLQGKADIVKKNQIITLKELDAYISSRVPELTDDLQIPVIHTPNGFKDFDLVWLN